MENLTEYRIHIPTHYNDGRTVGAYTIDALLDKALELFGGYTFGADVFTGAWRDPNTGKTYREGMRPLFISAADSALVNSFAELVKQELKQEAVYYVKQGEATIF